MAIRPWRVAMLAALWSAPVLADDGIADFYRGKTFTIVIGATPGGGYDTYARLLGRHLGKHIPGNPAVVPQNMPGASSNVAAIYMYNAAPKDGLALGAVTPGALMEPLLGDQVRARIDPARFNHVGSATRDVFVCVARRDVPVRRFEEAFEKELVIGAVAEGGSARDFPLLLNNAIGTKFRIVSGYPGNRELTLAVEKGEVQGVCGNSYAGLLAMRPDWFRPDGVARVIAQESMTGHPDFNRLGVPLAIDFARTEEQRQMMSLLYEELLFSRPYVMAPGAPVERVAAVRRAVSAALADPELLADAAKMNLEIADPLSGEAIQSIISRMYATPADIIERTRRAMKE